MLERLRDGNEELPRTSAFVMLDFVTALAAHHRGAVRVLEAIHKLGGVCDEYETCEHRACQHSYAAWALADAYLRGQ